MAQGHATEQPGCFNVAAATRGQLRGRRVPREQQSHRGIEDGIEHLLKGFPGEFRAGGRAHRRANEGQGSSPDGH